MLSNRTSVTSPSRLMPQPSLAAPGAVSKEGARQRTWWATRDTAARRAARAAQLAPAHRAGSMSRSEEPDTPFLSRGTVDSHSSRCPLPSRATQRAWARPKGPRQTDPFLPGG